MRRDESKVHLCFVGIAASALPPDRRWCISLEVDEESSSLHDDIAFYVVFLWIKQL